MPLVTLPKFIELQKFRKKNYGNGSGHGLVDLQRVLKAQIALCHFFLAHLYWCQNKQNE